MSFIGWLLGYGDTVDRAHIDRATAADVVRAWAEKHIAAVGTRPAWSNVLMAR